MKRCAALVCLSASVALSLIIGLALWEHQGGFPVLAQGQPPAGLTIVQTAAFSLSGQPSEFTASPSLVEFAPGAFLPRHYHDGPIFGLVLEGEVTRIVGGETTVYKVGESWIGGDPTDIHEYEGNQGTVPARFISTVLIPVGGTSITILPTP